MAYPTVAAPYGYKPVNLIGGQPYAGSTRNLPIAYNQSGAIFYGDPVTISSGFAVLPTTPVNSTNTIVGYFAGCYYTNPTTKQRLYSQYYPGSVTAGDITAIVVDDPDVVLKAAATTTAGGTTIGSYSLLLVGQNVVGGTQTGSTSNGDSALSTVPTSSAGASTAGFRVLNLVPDTQITYGATYVSGTGSANIVLSGLVVGTFLPVGTDLFIVQSNGLQFTGSTVATAVTVSSATSQTVVMTGTPTVSGTVALVQSPEALLKTNFGVHRYNIA
jgi:hypothetical protein